MKNCRRFEEEGLGVDTLSEELAQHVRECEECQQAQRSYENLYQLLRDYPMPAALPAGWKEKVWRAIAEQGQAQQQAQPKPSLWERCCALMRSYRWTLGGGVAAAVLLGVTLFSMDRQRPPLTASEATPFVWSVHDGATSHIRNAADIRLGNHIHFEAEIPSSLQAVLLVYLQDSLFFSCASAAPGEYCQKIGNNLKAQFSLERIGLYRALWVVSSKPLLAPQQGFDLDTAAFLSEGVDIQHPFSFEVH